MTHSPRVGHIPVKVSTPEISNKMRVWKTEVFRSLTRVDPSPPNWLSVVLLNSTPPKSQFDREQKKHTRVSTTAVPINTTITLSMCKMQTKNGAEDVGPW